jgi:hypothetical protein
MCFDMCTSTNCMERLFFKIRSSLLLTIIYKCTLQLQQKKLQIYTQTHLQIQELLKMPSLLRLGLIKTDCEIWA